MKKIGLKMATVALALIVAAPVPAQEKTQTTCPVLDGNINKNIYVDYKGHRIYFCCKGCDTEFKKDPEKYLKKMESQGITPEKSPAAAGKSAQ